MRVLLLLLALSGCGDATGCLANAYDGSPPQRTCTTGLQLPFGLLRDTDPVSTPVHGSAL